MEGHSDVVKQEDSLNTHLGLVKAENLGKWCRGMPMMQHSSRMISQKER